MPSRRTELWCLLIHSLPSRPLYLRARVRRLLGDAGAAPIRKSVYALPASDSARAALRAIAVEIESGGGSAFVCEASFPDEAMARSVVRAYNGELEKRYRAWCAKLERLPPVSATPPVGRRPRSAGAPNPAPGRRDRLRRELAALRARDRFGAAGGARAEALLARAERDSARAARRGDLAGLRWVTRRGVHVDRIACAWVVRRFIDPGAHFRFTANPAAPLAAGEIGFDMPDAEIGHREGGCSLETLLDRAKLRDPRLRYIADIVHDIDLKDARHGHPETAGFEQLVIGLVTANPSDEDRLDHGARLFDALFAARPAPPSPAAQPRIQVPAALRKKGKS